MIDLTGQIALWNPEELVPSSALDFTVYPPTYSSLRMYLYRAAGRVFIYQSYQCRLSELGTRLTYGQWGAGSESYWAFEFNSLLWQASKLGVADCRIRDAKDLAASDLFRACRQLLTELHRCVIESVAMLRAFLFFANIISAILLVQFAATVFQFRNVATLQRRFYLTHGSHPSDSPVDLSGILSGRSCSGRIPISS